MKIPFEQNVIALIWDFDKTLIDGYMQGPIFKRYSVDGAAFWDEVTRLESIYEKQGIRINRDTIYLNHIVTCAQQGIFKGLNNSMLRDMGKELLFYNGIPGFLHKIKNEIESQERYRIYNLTVEHYIISTGLAEMIKGSSIAPYVKGIWGCEFIERPVKSALNGKENDKPNKVLECESEITQVGYAIDNTSKTRAIFEINKGTNLFREIDVNSNIAAESRRVPFENMIYIADGPSDVPAFSILQRNGGRTFAVYPKGKMNAFEQVDNLLKDRRIDAYGEADYSEGTQTYMWLMLQVRQIADDICRKKAEAIRGSASQPPRHINE